MGDWSPGASNGMPELLPYTYNGGDHTLPPELDVPRQRRGPCSAPAWPRAARS